jgi:hypothetical protein
VERRFLVIVRAGDKSLHRGWLDGAERNWDLIVSWYSPNPYEPLAGEEVWPQAGMKWDVLASQLLARPDVIERYSHFVLADDDIEISAEAINTLFETAEREKLEVCQPGMTADSYYSALHHLRSPSFRLRYTPYVEVMFPCLSRAALKRALPLALETPSGFGLDFVWARLEPDNLYRAAIIDTIEMRHTRPVGSVLQRKMAEQGWDNVALGKAFVARFGVPFQPPHFMCYAGVTAAGRRVGAWGTRWRMALDGLRSLRQWRTAKPFGTWRGYFRRRELAPVSQVHALYDGPLRLGEGQKGASH